MKNKWTVSEVKELLLNIDTETNDQFQEFLLDERKGVQKAIQSWRKQKQAKRQLLEQYSQMNQLEESIHRKGFQHIAGVDEVGRGPLAGPVVAASVVLDPNQAILGLEDSKKLSLKKREYLFHQIKEKAISFGIGIAESSEIDHINIYQATKVAMERAIQNHNDSIDYLLIDAMIVNHSFPQQSVIKGDSKSNSIAAASILAKVTRDSLMTEYDATYPEYDFRKNAGYGTKSHLEALNIYGASPIHRKSFAPVKKLFKK